MEDEEQSDFEFDDEEDSPVESEGLSRFSEAVLYSTDWTVETVLNQLTKENIQLNPNFQRRDAWSNARKSRFIESVIIGLPVPQLVLAEIKGQRGKYIVLDGKQRLLSLLKFTGYGNEAKRGFRLSSLEARSDLNRVSFSRLDGDPQFEKDVNAFLNYTVRTVIIRNWPNREFLYQVFLRLNTGSVKLSPQELRQALAPGQFSSFVDDFAAGSEQILMLLGRKAPDPRMRDVELLVRFLAFQNRLSEYRGRMKSFLDDYCELENQNWDQEEDRIKGQAEQLNAAILALDQIFGEKRIARKPDSNSFNRAIFDALSFYFAREDIRDAAVEKSEDVRAAYIALFNNQEFVDAVESDTAGIPNTYTRLRLWRDALVRQLNIEIPEILVNDEGKIVEVN